MVFESVVVDILNRYLKPYVKRLDTSQLKVGVWKGEEGEFPELTALPASPSMSSLCYVVGASRVSMAAKEFSL